MFWSIPADMKQTWRELNLEELKHEILTIAPHAEPLIRQLHTIDQLTFADYFDTVMEKPYAGRVVALGDAYHSMSPQLGNGANLALWDAMQLSEAIDKHLNLDQALEAFANERRPHVWFYGFASRMLTPYFQSYSRVLGWGRDMFMGIFSAIPFFNKLMVIVLCGIRRGMFKRYDIDQLAKTFAKKP
jgi:2-polyprenyl-6-methoxyphenol hydroxylase-like FAD-dependent oxidoreductase